MKIWKEVFRKNRAALVVFAAMIAGNAAVFRLYGVASEPLVYAAVLALFLLAAIFAADYVRATRRSAYRTRTLEAIETE